MKFSTGLVALLATVSSVAAIPFRSGAPSADLAPVPVTKLVCDGDTFLCTASLDFGDGNWIAQWTVSVIHNSLWGGSQHKSMRGLAMAPVPVTTLKCDGDTFLCTANLDFGDGNWVAQWPTSVFHNIGFGSHKEVSAMAPVPVTTLTCDGTSFKCTGNLDFADGNWVAQWSSAVIHQSSFLNQN